MKKFVISLSFIAAICLSSSKLKAISIPHDSINTRNISSCAFQLSFIPYLGTNGVQSPKYVNHISFNILAGYNGGTTGFELGGLFNIDKYDVTATQIAGLGNANGGETKGVQIAGICNLSKITTGTQLAGITNLSTVLNGVQIGGISNHTLSGKSAQIAGLVNLTEDRSAFQIGGLANYAKSCEGAQIAGLINISKESSDAQIAGILNVSRHIKGTQIGLINIADSCSGVPIGLISIVKNGYHQFEISADEFFQANIAFRSGVEKFHGIITAGIQPRNLAAPLWSYGLGAGTSQGLSEKTVLDFDATFHHIVKKSEVGNNYLYKVYLGIDRVLSSKISVSVGVTYNFLTTDLRDNAHPEDYSDIDPYSFSDQNYNHFNLKTWAGLKVGLRFR